MGGQAGLDIFSIGAGQIVLLAVTAFAASTVAGVTGFGGAAILLPVLVAIFGVRDAIPILTVAQLIGNGSRVWFNRQQVVLPVVGWFSLGAVPLALLGGFLFAKAPLPLLTHLVGVFLLLTVVWRHLRRKPSYRPTLHSFVIIGAGFSFLSALVGSVGPILAPFFLAYGLMRGAYIGTEALATVVMHVTKLVAYGGSAALTTKAAAVGLALGPLMMAGSYTGKRILERLPERFFIVLIEAVLIIAGLTLLVTG
ncbi:MAG TPA: sulfite exporter TauE/SafE family protein [Chloroflexia bacterium]|nr:sulfite exporter TauE/SafE family protein [Chloroflexia bacterium]